MKHPILTPPDIHRERGSVLLESLIAILVFSLGILGLVGLQATSMKNTAMAKERIDAAQVANQRLAIIRLDKLNKGNYQEAAPGTRITELPNGRRITTVNGDDVTVTVTWRMPDQTVDNSFSTMTRIKGGNDA